jgi:nucleotide-binding universal stress UspA family protein
MYRSLLVPLDGSPFSEQALPLALGVARRSGAGIMLLHVQAPLASIYTENPLFVADNLEEHLRSRQRAHDQGYLDGIAKRLVAGADVHVTTALFEGEVAAGIRAEVERTGAGLVVMTTHGRGPVGRFWLGSVADELIRTLDVPLLLVRPGEEAAVSSKEPSFRRILVPLDGSELAEGILEPTVALGSLMGAEYTLVRVINPVLRLSYIPQGPTLDQMAKTLLDRVQTLQEEVRKQARDYLEGVARRLRQRGLAVATRVVVDDDPAVAIMQAAADFDLIAIETHGRRGLKRLFLGSVANKVLRGTALPMLVHRPHNQ